MENNTTTVFAHNYNMLRWLLTGELPMRYSDGDNVKPQLYIGENCHSCAIYGHQTMLQLNKLYCVANSTTKVTPQLVMPDGKTYTGLELNRKILADNNITNVTENQLQSMLTNDHINCNSAMPCHSLHRQLV